MARLLYYYLGRNLTMQNKTGATIYVYTADGDIWTVPNGGFITMGRAFPTNWSEGCTPY